MNDLSTISPSSPPPQLSTTSLRQLAKRWLKDVDVPDGWTARQPVDSLITEALHLAGLADESSTPLLPPDEGRDLRQLALACRSLHDQALKARADRTEVSRRRALRREGIAWIREAVAALRYISPQRPLDLLPQKLRELEASGRDAHGLAFTLTQLSLLCRHYKDLLSEIGIEYSFIDGGYSLGQAVGGLKIAYVDERLLRKEVNATRNRLLFVLYERCKQVRTTLRFAHRGDRAFLKRLARPRK